MAISHNECLILYARYMKSKLTLDKFCTYHQIPYWDFSEWVNQWEKLHGAKYVEESTVTHFKNLNRIYASSESSIPPVAQKIFPLEFMENNPPLRIPGDPPSFNVNLELPESGTIIKGAIITLPSGAILEVPEITIKGLILMVILYEGNCIRTD